MPAYCIVYTRGDAQNPETVTASFNDLDQALTVFAARGLRIVYIAERSIRIEKGAGHRSMSSLVADAARGPAARGDAKRPARSSSFPLRRFSSRVMV